MSSKLAEIQSGPQNYQHCSYFSQQSVIPILLFQDRRNILRRGLDKPGRPDHLQGVVGLNVGGGKVEKCNSCGCGR